MLGLLLVWQQTESAHAKEVTIRNRYLVATVDGVSGRVSIASTAPHRTFLNAGLRSTGAKAITQPASDPSFGQGRVIQIQYPDGTRDTITMFPDLPFALLRTTVRNTSSEPSVLREVKTLKATLDLGRPASAIRTLGTGGLLAPDKNPGSYMWLTFVEPQSRNGVVLGWLTSERGSGVLFSKVTGTELRAEAQIDYGHLQLPPGATEDLETLAVGYFEDARLGLEAWAEAVAKRENIHLPPQPVGYCTWYSQPYGGASDEKHLAEQTAFAAKKLAPFGFSVVQIDDHWQAGISTNGPKRNFTTPNPEGPYPGGMKATAHNIKASGLVPGLWFMPFAGTYYDPLFKDHQDWFVRHADGSPYETDWGGTCLDMTHPGAREHLRRTVERIAREWGFGYFKMDGLWTGTATRQQYVNSGYRDDEIGDAVFHDEKTSNLEAYRSGLKLVRDTVGRGVFILGCCSPQNMRSYGGAFGLVDAMRIGPDNGTDWESLLRGPTFGSRQYFLNGRVWYNDPDPIYVRSSVPLAQAQLICSWVTLSGQLNLSSEWLPGLPAERLNLLKRTMPSHGLKPRPVDIFEREIPSIWLLADTRSQPRRDVIGVFNWESTDQAFDYPLERVGLDAAKEYFVFDYWQNASLPVLHGRLHIDVPARSCRVLAVRPRTSHPIVLSTSRHITQGMVDMAQETWNWKTRTLTGSSRLVGGDAYELRIAGGQAPQSFRVSLPDEIAGVQLKVKTDSGLTRVVLDSPDSREVSWKAVFP